MPHAARHLQQRQDAPGIDPNAVKTANTNVGTDTALAFDPTAVISSVSAPPIAALTTPAPIISPSSASSGAASTETPASVSASSSTSAKPISLSTVIGSCVGAFIGAAALIVLSVWFYKRYTTHLKKSSKGRSPLIHQRNHHGDAQRRRSKMEPWNKLESLDDAKDAVHPTQEYRDKSREMNPSKEIFAAPIPADSMNNMFNKSPSIRTAYTPHDVAAFDYPQSYADFEPNLAKTLTVSQSTMPEPRPLLAKVDANPTLSWNESIGNGSYSSPSQIPNFVSQSHDHKWESAEVVQYSDVPDNNKRKDEDRKSVHNPFFNAHDYNARPSRSRSNSLSKASTRSSVSSSYSKMPTTPIVKSSKAKGKERARYSQPDDEDYVNPFSDSDAYPMPTPTQFVRAPFAHHVTSASTASAEDKERALQSLIAALDIPEDEARLRIASMQPSIVSQSSFDEVDVSREFPLPPGPARKDAS